MDKLHTHAAHITITVKTQMLASRLFHDVNASIKTKGAILTQPITAFYAGKDTCSLFTVTIFVAEKLGTY